MKLKIFSPAAAAIFFLGWVFFSSESTVTRQIQPIKSESPEISLSEKESEFLGRERKDFSPTATTKIFFAGDLMLDRQMRALAEKYGSENFLDDVVDIFAGHDAAVFNLEGVIGERPSLSRGKPQSDPAHFKFTFAPEAVRKFLKQVPAPVIFADGNNHSLDFGYTGLTRSRLWLGEEGVEFFGDIRRGRENFGGRVLRKNFSGRKISFVGYNAFLGNDPEKTLRVIAAEKAAGREVIVYAHWGEEYSRSLPTKESRLAADFAAAGARLIIGTHPHVIQPVEIHGQTPVFYSLGNFIFDQFFSREVKERMVLSCRLTDEETSCRTMFLYQSPREGLSFVSAQREKALREFLAENSPLEDARRKELTKKGSLTVRWKKE